MTREELAERLEAAEEGSRELSDEVLLAMGWEKKSRTATVKGGANVILWYWTDSTGATRYDYPDPTTDMNAALALVPEEWTAWELHSRANKTRFVAYISRMKNESDEASKVGRGATPALALCAAVLKACAA